MSNAKFETTEDGISYVEGERKTWICSRISVAAYTRDENNEDWGRLIKIIDRDGQEHEWIMQMSILSSEKGELISTLSSLGAEVSQRKRARELLPQFIREQTPSQSIRVVSRIGWHGENYIAPEKTYKPHDDGELVKLSSESKSHHTFRSSGTLLEWQEHISKYCQGNSRLTFGVCAAFAPPFIAPLDEESGGFHLIGNSSTGKTTILYVAGSVWGGSPINGFLKKWRTTINGLEGIALSHCDAFLPLDEFGEVDPRDAGNCAYMLSNQSGKTRSDRYGRMRKPHEWRVGFLSTGELGLVDHMNEANRRARAGQENRMADILADAGKGMGAFETLHGFPSPSDLARHLKEASLKYYGTPIHAFLDELVKNRESSLQFVREEKDRFLGEVLPENPNGQVRRVAERFALVAAAGAFVAEKKIILISRDECHEAVKSCFNSWLESRGGNVELERQKALLQVREFFQRNGVSAFQGLRSVAYKDVELVMETPTGGSAKERGGFREADLGGTIWYVFPEFFKNVICKGLNAKIILELLREQGHLQCDLSSGTPSVVKRFYAQEPRRYYCIHDSILGDRAKEDGEEIPFEKDRLGNPLVPNNLEVKEKGVSP